MSEEIPETTDAAIRGWIVAIAFTLVLVGGELMSEKDASAVRFWLGLGLVVAGLPCYLSAGWWKTLKPNLNVRFLLTLNGVATDARWWFGILVAFLVFLTFSPFIEQKRWPFSVWFAGPSQEEVDNLRSRLNTTMKDLNDAQQQIAREPARMAGALTKAQEERNAARKEADDANAKIAALQRELDAAKQQTANRFSLRTTPSISLLPSDNLLLYNKPIDIGSAVSAATLSYDIYNNSLSMVNKDYNISDIKIEQEHGKISYVPLHVFIITVVFKEYIGPVQAFSYQERSFINLQSTAGSPQPVAVGYNEKNWLTATLDLSSALAGNITITFYKKK